MRLTLLFVLLSSYVFGQEFSSRFELVKMDNNVNTFRHEGAPLISPDGSTLYFFVMNHPENTLGKKDTQDIWFSKKDENGNWSPAQHLGSPFNIHPSNQVFTILPDGSIFIKGGKSKGEKGFSIVRGNSLTELTVKEFTKMNKGRFYGATMSADMNHIIMYFSEVENSPYSDLYISHKESDGTYSRPEKLSLSTKVDDLGPFIAPDQKSLYFASARQAPGRQGNTDIYKSERLDDTWTSWGEPKNLGKPVNTAGEDFYFTMDNEGNVFTSRSNKAAEGMQLDLFMLVPKTFKVNVNGIVINDKTKDPVQAAKVRVTSPERQPLEVTSTADGSFDAKMNEVAEYSISTTASGYHPKELKFTLPTLYNDTTVVIEIPLTPVAKKLMIAGNVYNKKTNELISAKLDVSMKGDRNTKFSINSPGSYEKEISKLGWYMIAASAEGFINGVDSVYADSEELTPFTKDLYLDPIEIGVTVRLKNIYFDFDKTTLKRESFVELNKVVEFLKQNSTVEIEIAGHTDDKGSDEYNENLSQGRSQSVVDYLISQGIASYRLSAHGYGESKPIDTNQTEQGRANNRRVEFTVLKK